MHITLVEANHRRAYQSIFWGERGRWPATGKVQLFYGDLCLGNHCGNGSPQPCALGQAHLGAIRLAAVARVWAKGVQRDARRVPNRYCGCVGGWGRCIGSGARSTTCRCRYHWWGGRFQWRTGWYRRRMFNTSGW